MVSAVVKTAPGSTTRSKRKRLRSAMSAKNRVISLSDYLAPSELSTWESFSLLEEMKIARVLGRVASKFGKAQMADLVVEHAIEDFDAAWSFYQQGRFDLHPEEFFQVPTVLPHTQFSSPYSLSRGEVVDLSFESGFVPVYKRFRPDFESLAENKVVHARIWRHPKGESLGTIVAIHGWLMGDNRLSAVTLVPGFFFKLGLDVVVYELPYHGRRAGDATSILFPSPNLARTNEGFGQAIHELRTLRNWVETQNDKPVGVIGLSLGGYISALWASLDELAFAICIAPLVSMSEIAWSLLTGSDDWTSVKKKISMPHFAESDLKGVYAMHCPLNHQPRVPLERRMILAGVSDEVIPLSQPESLWRHWQKPRIHWLAGGHLGQVVERGALKHVHNFLQLHRLAHAQLLDIRNEH